MKDVVFVTSNQKKADRLAELLDVSILRQSVELDEIQSSDVETVAIDKAKRAFEIIKKPVLVEDVSLEFEALGGLSGPFIKFFVSSENGLENCCRMLDGFSSRKARARTVFVYFDGQNETVISGGLSSEIAESPRGKDGWDWDYIFCPDGYGGKTRAELSAQEDNQSYLSIKPITKLKDFLKAS